MILNQSSVIYNEQEHTYTLDGKQLKGITGMLKRQLFPNEYDNIPEAILKKAAERGHAIHSDCEVADAIGVATTIEAKNYLKLCKEYGLNHEASEYIVSDNEYFASPIDKVYRVNDDTFTLADIKTTYKLNEEYVKWQLSVYAELFEWQNPGAKIDKLLAIWLRDENAKIVEVERVPAEVIRELLLAEIKGLPFVYLSDEPTTLPEKYKAIEGKISYIIEMEKYWTGEKKRLVEGIKKEMVLGGAYKWEGEKVKITRNKESIRKEFDKEAFKKDYPDLYNKYIKEVSISGSLTIKTI
jgi:hypothetical protein